MAERRTSRSGVVPGLANIDPRQFIVPDPCDESGKPVGPAERRNWAEVRRMLHLINQGDNILNDRGDIDVNNAEFVDARVHNDFHSDTNAYFNNAYFNNLYQFQSGGSGYTVLTARSFIRFTITALSWQGNSNWVTATPDFYWEAWVPNGVGNGSVSPVDVSLPTPLGIFIPPDLWPNRAIGDIGLARVLQSTDDRLQAPYNFDGARAYVAIYIEVTAAVKVGLIEPGATLNLSAAEQTAQFGALYGNGGYGPSQLSGVLSVDSTAGEITVLVAGHYSIDVSSTANHTSLPAGKFCTIWTKVETNSGSGWGNPHGKQTVSMIHLAGVTSGGPGYGSTSVSFTHNFVANEKLRLRVYQETDDATFAYWQGARIRIMQT